MLGVTALTALMTAMVLGQLDSAHAAMWHVPLQRHSSARTPLETVLDAHRRLTDTKKKARVWTPDFRAEDLAGGDRSANQHGVVPVDFRDISMNIFAAKLSIGTPPQLVSLVLDVGSSDLMVLNHAIGNHLFYDHAKSSTYQANGTQVKVDEGKPYEVDGFVSRDHVALGSADSASRIEVHDQLLVELTGPATMLNLFPSKMDGFIGIGPGHANSTGAPSLVRSMIQQQLLDRPEVGLSYGEVIAHAVFGGVDAAYSHNDFHYFAQQQDTGYWSAPVSGILVDSKHVVRDIGIVRITETDLMLGPADVVDALADAVGAENYALPCDSPGPDLTFQLGDGFQVTLTKKDYAIPQGQGWCMFAMIPVAVPQLMLGLPFLRHVYTVLDFGASEREQRIGFALIKP